MKHLTILLTCCLALCLSASAQFTPQQYPFPYNPDSNQDGMVSMTDFLEILGLFGQEYPNSFFSDSTTAVLNLGRVSAPTCMSLASATDFSWRMVTLTDLFKSTGLICEAMNDVPWNYYDYDYANNSIWCWNESVEYTASTQITRYDLSLGNGGDSPFNYELQEDSTKTFRIKVTRPYNSGEVNLMSGSYCLLITEVKPTIEYMECFTSECIEDALNNGWQPLGGRDEGMGLWREAEE